jgi:hypothetical protein
MKSEKRARSEERNDGPTMELRPDAIVIRTSGNSIPVVSQSIIDSLSKEIRVRRSLALPH